MIQVPKTAMVLAAGLGTRMRPLTETTAKPLIEVTSKPLIDWAMDALVAAGVERAVVNVHWYADKVEAHLKQRRDLEIIFSDEREQPLETGGGLAKARPLLGDDPVYVVNTDAFWFPADPAPLKELAEAYDPSRMDDFLMLADTGRCLGFPGAGDFFRNEAGQLKRRGEASSAPWAFAGVRITRPEFFDGDPVAPFSVMPKWEAMIENGRLCGWPLDRFWLHVGTPDALADAEMWLRCHGV
ncbi:MAG: nucleotidyltransferase family protein [Pseudomonadota bacterium]